MYILQSSIQTQPHTHIYPTGLHTLTRVREGDLYLVKLVPDLPNLVSLCADDGAVETLVDVDVPLLLILHLRHQLLQFLPPQIKMGEYGYTTTMGKQMKKCMYRGVYS